MSPPVTPGFLRSLAFLSPLTDEEAGRLADVARLDDASAAAVLFREGDHLSHFRVVVSGTVAIEINGRDRRPRRLHTVGPGELLGWSPVLGGGGMTATARALTDVRLVALDASAVLALCDADPRFGYQLMRRVAAAVAARLNATRLQLLDVYGHELPVLTDGGRP